MAKQEHSVGSDAPARVQAAPEGSTVSGVMRQFWVGSIFSVMAFVLLVDYLRWSKIDQPAYVYGLTAAAASMLLVLFVAVFRAGPRHLAHVIAQRDDSEHEQAFIRVLFVCFVIPFYYGLFRLESLEPHQEAVAADAYSIGAPIFLFLAYLAILHIFKNPGVVIWRRYAANFLDNAGVTILMILGGEVSAPLFVVYLWVTFGCGLRFGLRSMVFSAVLSIVGYVLVLLFTPFWTHIPFVGYGLLFCLVALPAYGFLLVRSLITAVNAAEAASQAKSRFLATISHELRTPLNAIIGVASMIKNSGLNPEQRFLNQSILSSARTLLSLINNILNFSKFESEKIVAQPAPFNLHQLLAEVESMFAVQAREKNLQFCLYVDPAVPGEIISDADHLRGVMVNLVGNALKFTEAGSVSIIVTAQGPRSGERELTIRIVDTGIGIPQDKIHTIFESFRQGDESITRRFGGSGLGLTIVRQLVNAMEGQIKVTSEEGRGSRFEVHLPLVPAAEEIPDAGLVDRPIFVLTEDKGAAALIERAVADLGGRLMELAHPGELSTVEALRDEDGYRPVLITDEAQLEPVSAWLDASLDLSNSLGPVLIGLAGDDRGKVGLDTYDRRWTSVLRRPLQEKHLMNALKMASALSGRNFTDGDAEGPSHYPRPLEILVAEDNAVNRQVIGMMLRRGGHNATLVEDGEQALDALRDYDFDLVLMDLNMPNMSGPEAVKLYRFTNLGRENVPIIALTADSTTEGRRRAMEVEMDGYLVKPIEAEELIRVIETVVPASRIRPPATKAADPAASGPTAGKGQEQAPVQKSEDAMPIIDEGALQSLRSLGDDAFFAELVTEFLSDAERAIARLEEAVRRCDAQAVRDQAHALRSSAAYFGAKRLHECCLRVQGITQPRLQEIGADFLRSICNEYEALEPLLLHAAGLTEDDGKVTRFASVYSA